MVEDNVVVDEADVARRELAARRERLRRAERALTGLRDRWSRPERLVAVAAGAVVVALALPWSYDDAAETGGFRSITEPHLFASSGRATAQGRWAAAILVVALVVVVMSLLVRRGLRPAAGVAGVGVVAAVIVDRRGPASGIGAVDPTGPGVRVALAAAVLLLAVAFVASLDPDANPRWRPLTVEAVRGLLPAPTSRPALALGVGALVLAATGVAVTSAPWWIGYRGASRPGVDLVGEPRLLIVAGVVALAAVAAALVGVRRAAPAIVVGAAAPLVLAVLVWRGWGPGSEGSGLLLPALVVGVAGVGFALAAPIVGRRRGPAGGGARLGLVVSWPAAVIGTAALVVVAVAPLQPMLDAPQPTRSGPYEVLAGIDGASRFGVQPRTGDPTATASSPAGAIFVGDRLALVGDPYVAVDDGGRLEVLRADTVGGSIGTDSSVVGLADGWIVTARHGDLRLIEASSKWSVSAHRLASGAAAMGADGRIWFDPTWQPGGLRVATAQAIVDWVRDGSDDQAWPGSPASEGPVTSILSATATAPVGVTERDTIQAADDPRPWAAFVDASCRPGNDPLAIPAAPRSSVEVGHAPSGDLWVSVAHDRLKASEASHVYVVRGGRLRAVREPVDEAVTLITFDPANRPVLTTRSGRVLRVTDPDADLIDLPDPDPACVRPDLEVRR